MRMLIYDVGPAEKRLLVADPCRYCRQLRATIPLIAHPWSCQVPFIDYYYMLYNAL